MDSDKSRCKLVGKTSYDTPVEVFEEALDTVILLLQQEILNITILQDTVMEHLKVN